MSGPTSSGAGVPFGWNFLDGFGVVRSQARGISASGGFYLPWLSTPFPGDKFSLQGVFPFVNTSGPGGFLPGNNFGNIFHGRSTFSPKRNPLGGMFGYGSSHAPGSATILMGTLSLGSPM
jgi:hypothetical protein